MNALKVLASPRVWGPILGLAAVLALIFYAYLGAVASPERNLEDLPLALVNEDEGGNLGGKDVTLATASSRRSPARIHRRPEPSSGRVRTPAARRSKVSATTSITVPS